MVTHCGIIFDLDGTLLDTIEDIATSLNSVLAAFGFPIHSLKTYKGFVGEGFELLVKRVLPPDFNDPILYKKILTQALASYEEGAIVKTKTYPGIEELLTKLTFQKIPLAILSNKPHSLTQKSVAALLNRYPFKAVWGARPPFPNKPHPLQALKIATLFKPKAERIFLVGDSEIDIQTARNARFNSVAVSWGFRPVTKLLAFNPDWLIHQPEALLEIIRQTIKTD